MRVSSRHAKIFIISRSRIDLPIRVCWSQDGLLLVILIVENLMKLSIYSLIVLVACPAFAAEEAPTYAEVSYGPHAMQVLDFWKAAGEVGHECHLLIQGVSKSDEFESAKDFLISKLLTPRINSLDAQTKETPSTLANTIPKCPCSCRYRVKANCSRFAARRAQRAHRCADVCHCR
jgi:hypothetical protein